MKILFEWEDLDTYTQRAKIIGGWLVRTVIRGSALSMVYIPDVHHAWEISDMPECHPDKLPLESFP